MRVLLVEDEPRLAANLAAALREGPGFAVDQALDGETADEMAAQMAAQRGYDLVILDLMLPKLDGQSVLRRIRARRDPTPVLILTAKDGKNAIVELLNSGADDYLAKPFDLGELIARAKALIRRGKGVPHPLLKAGDLEMNTLEQSVTRAGVSVDLSPTEYRILELLVHNPRRIFSKQDLLEHLYDFNWEHHSNVIEAHVSNLRRKLDAAAPGSEPGSEPVIETRRGRGYRLSSEHAQ